MNLTKRMFGRPGIVSTFFYLGCIVLVATMWGLTSYVNSLHDYAVLQPGDPGADALSKAESSFAALTNLLTSLATGLLAGLGWFLTSGPKQRDSVQQFWPAAISALCGCVSLFWGYIASQNVEFVNEISVSSLDTGLLQWPRKLQFYSLLLGVFFFFEFVRRDLTREDRRDGSKNVPNA